MGLGSMGMGLGSLGMGFGGLGMTMSMHGMNQDSLMYRSMRTIESANYAVSSLSQVTRSLESNTEGIYRLYESLINLFKGCIEYCSKYIRKAKRFGIIILNFFLGLFRLKKIELEKDEDEEAEEEVGTEEEKALARLRKREKRLAGLLKIMCLAMVAALIFSNIREKRVKGMSPEVEKKLAELFAEAA